MKMRVTITAFGQKIESVVDFPDSYSEQNVLDELMGDEIEIFLEEIL